MCRRHMIVKQKYIFSSLSFYSEENGSNRDEALFPGPHSNDVTKPPLKPTLVIDSYFIATKYDILNGY